MVLKSPFSYPYFIFEFNVSGKRGPQIDDLLDTYLISGGFTHIQNHWRKIDQWKQESCQRIEHSLLKKYRRKQYEHSLDDNKAFRFFFVRSQTRYRQRNYVKSSYRVNVRTNSFAYNYEYIQHRYDELACINFECTLREYHSKNQRKLATRELRERIMKRDNYTCQICGKYMPDEVGLQIDHIVPIAKGGKTIPSNLRVLCSKCNGSKHDKMPI
ncbi:MAG: HNH endonuclease [Anaerotruncus sp.]|jgi:5-methylcytosine-specific restriction endonuclease McrA|nr:HNH endonuclease [Anaerotruncus sp.]